MPLLLKFDITIKFQKEVCDMADNEKYLIRLHGKDIEVSEDVYYYIKIRNIAVMRC